MDVTGDEREEAFDLVEAGSIGWCEVNVPARTSGEPSPDLGCLWVAWLPDEMDVRRAGKLVSMCLRKARNSW